MEGKLKPLKYPSTPHLPFSPSVFDDDIQLKNCEQFVNKDVIITEKMDGGNCQLFQGNVYARTTSKVATHESFNKIKSLYPSFSYKQPKNIALYGENMYAIHSIEYNNLSDLYYLFAVLKDGKKWLSFSRVKQIAEYFGLTHVPILFEGKFKSSKEIQKWMENRAKQNSIYSTNKPPEGFVIRLAKGFEMDDFEKSMGKYVRKNHVQTKENWKSTFKKAKLSQ